MKLTLVKKQDEASGTKSFFFSSDEKISWQAGQYIYITLPKLNYPDERGDTRHFTISNSPTEGDLVRVTVRIRQESGYKKTLDELEIGTIVEGKGPQGTFIFDRNTSKTNTFVAGGIGITPFRSMIKYLIDTNQKEPIHLIFSNGDQEFVFKDELDKWQSENSFLTISYFDSSVSGHLDADKITSLCSSYGLQNTCFWVVGPNPFVYAIEEILDKLQIPEDNIKTEKFTGY